jgi:RHS repeat-associated protein
MNPHVKALLRLVALLALVSVAPQASAYYDPGVQRWINRDPLGEHGFIVINQNLGFTVLRDENLYLFVLNSPIYHTDPLGLTVKFKRKCNTIESLQCEAQCGDSGMKSCDIQEEYQDVPGKPPKKVSSTMICICKDNKPGSWRRCIKDASKWMLID